MTVGGASCHADDEDAAQVGAKSADVVEEWRIASFRHEGVLHGAMVQPVLVLWRRERRRMGPRWCCCW